MVTICPYVCVTLSMFLCNLASNYSAENSFSTLHHLCLQKDIIASHLHQNDWISQISIISQSY
ncbi:Cathepsin B [Aphis craccivora]|uniref:Cathepsin B n=1 Tax=Aphis craccivora TaxID=307492 RepID=A0A6G0YVR1_APHCR|nr:Cathepsin B [Aphis craccivora]